MSQDELRDYILKFLDEYEVIEDTKQLKWQGSEVDQLSVLGVLNSLTSKEMIEYQPIEKESWFLTEEGQEIVDTNSHEVRVFNAIPPDSTGIPIQEIQKKLGNIAKVGQGKAFKNKWIKKVDGNLVRIVSEVKDTTKEQLQTIDQTGQYFDQEILKDLKRRKLCDKQKFVSYQVKKGPQFSTVIEKQVTDITFDMLVKEEWKDLKLKQFNFEAKGVLPPAGHLHPLMKVREEFRQIFFEMGFIEMFTNRFVESSFWNFDTLFQPQQHPARDAHDTFFLKDPSMTEDLPLDLVEKVKKVHSVGGYDSIGYRYDWKIEEAQKLILRTHTTAISSNMLYLLAQQPEFKPVRYFSIDRVFRNETVDATHLAEFHQVEGVIADRNLTLGDLIGFMKVFFDKMGIEKLRFKPAYNPYTEPSMEIFAWHEGLNKWVEIGNSGMFRPEMLRPLGLDEDVRVIAWGLGLERPTMIKYGIENIRDLLGHKVDLAMIQANPICRLEKH